MNGNILKTGTVKTNLRRIFSASILVAAMGVYAGDGSAVMINADSISTAASVSGASVIELRVSGPGGFYTSEQSESGALDWYPGMLADGEYRYEVFVTVGEQPEEDAADETQLYRENGGFKVENGTLIPLEEMVPPTPADPDGQSSIDLGSWFEKLAGAAVDFLVPPAAAANIYTNPGDVYIMDSTPYIYWNDTDVAGNEWYTWGNSSSFGILDAQNGKYSLYTSVNPAFSIYEYTNSFAVRNNTIPGWAIYLDDASGLYVLHANFSGDISLADSSVFIDKSANFLGVGTTIPSQELHVVSTAPSLLLDDTVSGDLMIHNNAGEVSFRISNGTYNGDIMTFENDLTATLYPGVGIWEINPEVPLHVRSQDGKSGGLLVENDIAPTAAGDVGMFELRNTGGKTVRFNVNAGGSVWTFDNEPSFNVGAGVNGGRFRISKVGTGVPEFTVDGYGNCQCNGNSYATNHINLSSRAFKTDFKSLNEKDVLSRLMQLEISEWRYLEEDGELRHVGPVAEDFQKIFGLGDGMSISTVDSEGIALASIKAIKSEKDIEIAALTEENRILSDRLSVMAERLQALENLMLGQEQVSSR